MHFPTAQVLAGVLAMISAIDARLHIVYPAVRGAGVTGDETLFCGGYNNVGTRAYFPLDDAFVLFTTSSTWWTVGIQISTVANPDSFDDFHTSNGSEQLAVPYFDGNPGGVQRCVPINIGALGLPGVTDGSNVTLQLAQDDLDKRYYQCMDLTLYSTFKIPSDIQCVNQTAFNPNATHSGGPTPTGQSGGALSSMRVSGLLGLSALGFLISSLFRRAISGW